VSDELLRVLESTNPGPSSNDPYFQPAQRQTFVSATKEKPLAETNLEGSLTLPFGPFSLSEAEDEPPWVWDGFVAPGSLTLLSGWPKVGKTSLIFALLAALERGEAFLGLATRSVGVLLLTEERMGTLAGKVQRWNLNGDVQHLRRQQAKDEPWPEIVRQAVAYSRAQGLELLAVDTLAEWAQITNENEAGEVLAAMRPLQEAAAAGLAVLVGSHGRKAPGRHGEAVRGSNALTGAVDVVIEIERSHSFQEENVRVLRAISRYDQTPGDLVVALTDDGYEARGAPATARAEDEARRILEALGDLEKATTEDLAEATDLHASAVRRIAKGLFEREQLGRTGAGKRNDPYVWHSEFLSATADCLVAETKQSDLFEGEV
jgi:AAA domain